VVVQKKIKDHALPEIFSGKFKILYFLHPLLISNF